MSESPVSDPEKNVSSDKKGPYGDSTPVYVDEALGETEVAGFEETRELKRGLHQRHIQMIALAGTIGTVSCTEYGELGNELMLVGPLPRFWKGYF